MKFYVTKELINKVRELAKEDNINLKEEGNFDLLKHSFSESLIKNALVNGMIIEDKDLYPENPNLKHKGKNYYCIHKYKENLFYLRTVLISFIVNEGIVIFHVSSSNYMSREERYYRKNIKEFKELFP